MTDPDVNSMPPVNAELIAALIDGRLDPDERARVLEQLARSERDYEAYVDAIHTVRALETGGTPASAVREHRVAARADAAPGRRRPILSYRFLAAAAVVAAVLTTTVILTQRNTDEYTPAVLVALVDPAVTSVPGWYHPAWRVMRTGNGAALTERQLAFRLGVHLANLEAAERTADSAAIRAVAVEVGALAERLPGGSAYASLYRELQNLPADSERRNELRHTGWEAVAEALPYAELQLGVWVGAARLALLDGDLGWFDSEAARRVQSAIDGNALSPETRVQWVRTLRARDNAATGRDGLLNALDALVLTAAG